MYSHTFAITQEYSIIKIVHKLILHASVLQFSVNAHVLHEIKFTNYRPF